MLEKLLGAIKQKVSNYFLGALPKSYSMSEENNILGLYDEHFLLTKNENLVGPPFRGGELHPFKHRAIARSFHRAPNGFGFFRKGRGAPSG